MKIIYFEIKYKIIPDGCGSCASIFCKSNGRFCVYFTKNIFNSNDHLFVFLLDEAHDVNNILLIQKWLSKLCHL